VGIIEWLLVWLIVNALYVVWRILVTTEVETRESIDPQNAKRCRPLNGNGPGPSLRFLVG
jgi:hypothetical protein